MEKSAHKLELLRRIADLEKKQLWHLDVEDDPETYPLMPDQIDYLNEKISNKIKNKIANIFGARFFDKMIAKFSFICYTHLWTKLNSLNKRKFLIFHE